MNKKKKVTRLKHRKNRERIKNLIRTSQLKTRPKKVTVPKEIETTLQKNVAEARRQVEKESTTKKTTIKKTKKAVTKKQVSKEKSAKKTTTKKITGKKVPAKKPSPKKTGPNKKK